MTHDLTAQQGAIKLAWDYFRRMQSKSGIIYFLTDSNGDQTSFKIYPGTVSTVIWDETTLPPQYKCMNRRERRSRKWFAFLIKVIKLQYRLFILRSHDCKSLCWISYSCRQHCRSNWWFHLTKTSWSQFFRDLPFPWRENPILHSFNLQEHVQMLRMW